MQLFGFSYMDTNLMPQPPSHPVQHELGAYMPHDLETAKYALRLCVSRAVSPSSDNWRFTPLSVIRVDCKLCEECRTLL